MPNIWRPGPGLDNRKLDPARCRARVSTKALPLHWHQCDRKAIVEREYEGRTLGFCHQHDPVAEKARAERSDRREGGPRARTRRVQGCGRADRRRPQQPARARRRNPEAVREELIMKPRTLKALKRSIEKWEKIVAGTGIDEGRSNCPLCQMFRLCDGCPVMEQTGRPVCRETPYTEWSVRGGGYAPVSEVQDRPDLIKAAKAELAFLRSLLPSEVAP